MKLLEFLQNVSTPKIETIPYQSEPGARKNLCSNVDFDDSVKQMLVALLLLSYG